MRIHPRRTQQLLEVDALETRAALVPAKNSVRRAFREAVPPPHRQPLPRALQEALFDRSDDDGRLPGKWLIQLESSAHPPSLLMHPAVVPDAFAHDGWLRFDVRFPGEEGLLTGLAMDFEMRKDGGAWLKGSIVFEA